MSKKDKVIAKDLEFIAIGLKKLGKGYYQVVTMNCFTDDTFEVIDASADMSINFAEDEAAARILEASLKYQSK